PLADEDEEGGLEGVFGIVVVAEDTAAHAPHHRSMPMHQGCKSRLVTAADVVRQQFLIGQPPTVSQKHPPSKVLEYPPHLAGRHVLSFVGRRSPSILLLPAGGGLIHYSGWGGGGAPANQSLHADGGRMSVYRSSTPHQRPPRVSSFVRLVQEAGGCSAAVS